MQVLTACFQITHCMLLVTVIFFSKYLQGLTVELAKVVNRYLEPILCIVCYLCSCML